MSECKYYLIPTEVPPTFGGGGGDISPVLLQPLELVFNSVVNTYGDVPSNSHPT